jgi:hypothetical protein
MRDCPTFTTKGRWNFGLLVQKARAGKLLGTAVWKPGHKLKGAGGGSAAASVSSAQLHQTLESPNSYRFSRFPRQL